MLGLRWAAMVCGGAPEGEAVGGEGEGGKGCCDALHFVSVY